MRYSGWNIIYLCSICQSYTTSSVKGCTKAGFTYLMHSRFGKPAEAQQKSAQRRVGRRRRHAAHRADAAAYLERISRECLS